MTHYVHEYYIHRHTYAVEGAETPEEAVKHHDNGDSEPTVDGSTMVCGLDGYERGTLGTFVTDERGKELYGVPRNPITVEYYLDRYTTKAVLLVCGEMVMVAGTGKHSIQPGTALLHMGGRIAAGLGVELRKYEILIPPSLVHWTDWAQLLALRGETDRVGTPYVKEVP